jgi:hypothetical protein
MARAIRNTPPPPGGEQPGHGIVFRLLPHRRRVPAASPGKSQPQLARAARHAPGQTRPPRLQRRECGYIIAADATPAFLIDDQGDTMRRSSIRKAGLYILIFNFLVATFPQQALAGIIATPAAIAAQENNASLSRLKELLAREDVRGQLERMGIDPTVAEQRVNSLTPSEIAQLQPHLDSLPAGGDGLLAVIGIVFIVLLILELTGVINIFSKF